MFAVLLCYHTRVMSTGDPFSFGEDQTGSKSKGRYLLSMLVSEDFENALSFLPNRPDCNTTDGEGNSPLHLVLMRATRGLTEELIKGLLSEGADPNLENHNGETPLQILLSKEHMDCASLLLNAGADLEARDKTGKTWLFRMCGMGRIHGGLQKYLDLGARPDTR